MELLTWIRSLRPRPTTSDEALYQFMESQSAYSLVEIYQPFDATKRGHWNDEGAIIDFLVNVGEGDLLDFGPGDGWPSLRVAPHVKSVTGLDASPKRIEVCEANARRLGITNFRGVRYVAGQPMPFPDQSFDGAMAASSIEQSPDPQGILRELYRVLRPGGRLRIQYERPAWYINSPRQELELWSLADGATFLYLMERDLAAERVGYYTVILNAPLAAVKALVDVTGLAVPEPERLQSLVRDAMTYTLSLPSCNTWMRWLREVGFTTVVTTHCGGDFAERVFAALSGAERLQDEPAVFALLRPGIAAATGLEAPLHLDSLITATK
ncbi:MAG: class I SAM-dependent methyltransferase [Mycobacterium leprae]